MYTNWNKQSIYMNPNNEESEKYNPIRNTVMSGSSSGSHSQLPILVSTPSGTVVERIMTRTTVQQQASQDFPSSSYSRFQQNQPIQQLHEQMVFAEDEDSEDKEYRQRNVDQRQQDADPLERFILAKQRPSLSQTSLMTSGTSSSAPGSKVDLFASESQHANYEDSNQERHQDGRASKCDF
jgi:hypothetical protein